jgi:class 3 adenylate cyclase/tetratricopeptide (TPR) repeat protein
MTTPPSSSLPVDACSALQTFLIADVRGYTRFTQEHGDEAAAQLATRFATLTREGVAARGGQLVELRGDEALAVFGSARQALRAAVELQARFAQATQADPTLPLPVGIGLDAGEAVPVEGGYRGGALNLAARLCSLAGPGEVLASEAVTHLARRVPGLRYVERGFVQLKGFADPVHVLCVLPAAEATLEPGAVAEAGAPGGALPLGGFLGALPEGALVARERELGQILVALSAVVAGSGRLVLLAGEPGVGKTRLAQEVTLIARNRGFLIAAGRCYEPQQAVPYYPFLEALAMVFAAIEPAMRARLLDRWPDVRRLLPDQPLAPLAPAMAAAGLADGQEEQRLFWVVTSCIQTLAATRPVALLLDDLHWADGASLALLQHLARHTRSARVLLLGTYRDVAVRRQHPLEAALRDLGREKLSERIVVRRLPLEGTAALVATTMGTSEVSAEFVELLHQRTEGNPFFTQEVLRALVERGDIYRADGGRWERRVIAEIEVPESIRSAIGQRLAHLSATAQELLHEASTLGPAFTFADLLGVCTHDEETVETALEETLATGLVRETGRERYAFNHTLTQQALYAELSSRRKRRLHLAAGEALERRPERARRVAELAWHFLEADAPERALPYALGAGDQAEAVFAHSEAERHYRLALELAGELGDREREAEALEKLGAVLHTMARYDEALAALERAAAGYRALGDAERLWRTMARIGWAYGERGTPAEGIARLQPLVESLSPGDGSPGLAALHAALAHLFFVAGLYREQLATAERAADLARTAGDQVLLAQAEGRRAVALDEMGRMEEALQAYHEVILLAEALGDLDTLCRALGNISHIYMYRGAFDQSRLYAERVVEVAERLGDPAHIAHIVTSLAELAFYTGDWQQAYAHAGRAVALIRQVEVARSAPYSLAILGCLYLYSGEWETASPYLEEGLALAERSRSPEGIHEATVMLAERDLVLGHPEAARARLAPLIARLDPQQLHASTLYPLAWAYAELGDLAQAEAVALQAVTRARADNHLVALVDVLWVHALVAIRQERWPEAARALEETLALAHRMPYPYAEACALALYGTMHIQKGEPALARERLAAALAIFRRLGARKDAGKVEEALTDMSEHLLG